MICSKERERHEESVTIEKTFGISIFSLYHELSEQHHKQKGYLMMVSSTRAQVFDVLVVYVGKTSTRAISLDDDARQREQAEYNLFGHT